MGFSKREKPWTSWMAFSAAEVVSKTMKAWPLARRFFLATMSIIVPYWAKID